jgi:amino acid transporter
VALAWQFVLPMISSQFWLYGDGTGKYDAATNGVILGAILIILTTIINAAGSRAFSIINNIGVTVELVASVLMIIFLALHIQRGPQVVMQTQGTGAGHSLGYVGALMMALLLGTYIMWGFDTAGSVGEETVNPRKTNPTAIIRALAAAGLIGGVLMLVALMAVGNIHAKELSTSGLPYILQSVLGTTLGDIFLVCVAIAIFVCGLCNQAGAIRMIFAMSRDNGLPGGRVLAHVSPRTKTPIVPALVTGFVAILILLANIRQPQIFVVVTSTTVILALLSYVLVVGPFALKKMRGEWQQPEKGYFTLGRWGLLVSIAAFAWGVFVIVDIAWPRSAVYNPVAPFHWYLQWGGILFVVIVMAIGGAWYGLVQRHKIGVLAEHAATPADMEAMFAAGHHDAIGLAPEGIPLIDAELQEPTPS